VISLATIASGSSLTLVALPLVLLALWFVGSYRAWRSEEIRAAAAEVERDALLRESVPEEHRVELRKFVGDVRLEFSLPMPVRPPLPDALVAAAARVHFPQLMALLTEWLAAEGRIDGACAALDYRLRAEVQAMREPAYEWGDVVGVLSPRLRALARGDGEGAGFGYEWKYDPPEMATVTVRSALGVGVATLPAAPQETLDTRVATVTGRVDRLYADARGWDEVTVLGAAFNAYVAMKSAVYLRAELETRRVVIPMEPQCPICAVNLGRSPQEIDG
jgi:hypothetical protein